MGDRDEDLTRAIRQRDVPALMKLMFEGDPPRPKTGFRTEGRAWDFKSDCPRPSSKSLLDANAWASFAADVLGFHNAGGGVLVLGTRDDYSFSGCTIRLDSKLVNDQLRRYLGDVFWVEFHREAIQPDQRYLGLVLVPPRGARIARFRMAAPEVGGSRLFEEDGSALREGDSTRILSREEADQLSRSLATPVVGQIYAVDEPFYRILAPEYLHFIERQECRLVEEALHDPRSSVASVIGIGGVGKTALATWAVLRAYEAKAFEFIISMTAKDRELSSSGIRALSASLTSFETLLDQILAVLGLKEDASPDVKDKERSVRALLEDSNGLIYVDNLETVDDARIIEFLDRLPVGVRAIVTSRRSSVRRSAHPVDVGPLRDDEVTQFVGSLAQFQELSWVVDLAPAECARIGQACDGIPLAIRWVLAQSFSPSEAVASAEQVTASGRHGEELLEFCFRRVFDSLSEPERTVLEILSLFQQPIATEALLAGTDLPGYRVMDALEDLVSEALVQRLFDPDQNDYAYTLLPMTRAFVYGQVSRQPRLESRLRRRLSDWFEAKDVKDGAERLVIRELRQGKGGTEAGLLSLAAAAERRGDTYTAQDLYEQALRRNPRSWRAARLYAEFLRHKLDNRAKALQMYEQAAANAPSRGSDRALIFREWGMLLRDSGDPRATDLAVEKFEVAVAETPNDEVATHALAHMLQRKGAFRRVAELLEPLRNHPRRTTRAKTLPLLQEAYERLGELLKAAEVREQMERESL